MCEFVSWIETDRGGKKSVLFLDDELLFSERSEEILKGSKDNDFLGHHAIRNVWNLKENEGREGEEKNFWEAKRLPKELQPKLKDCPSFKKHFGRMVENYAQTDDLRYIAEHAPKSGKWKGLKEFAQEKLDALAQRRIGELLKSVKLEKLPITDRSDQSINDLVKQAELNYANENINNKNFKEEKKPAKKREAVLVHINQVVSTEEAEAITKPLKLTLGNVKELLSLSIDHPDKQKQFPIVELSSSWRGPGGDRGVAYLHGWGGRRGFGLSCRDDGWFEYFRFLAFSEV